MSSTRGDVWFKFYPSDWLRATRGLTLEQRGAYIDTIAMQMEHGKALPDDCSWLAHQMHISTRKARSIVDQLIELKKVNRTPEGLTNERCEIELAAREKQRMANTNTAFIRERLKREPALNQSRTDAEPTLNQTPIKVENQELSNKINEATASSCNETSTTRARVELEEERREEKESNTPPTPKGVERKKLKVREIAKIAFDEWCELAHRIGLSVPREKSFNDARARDIFNRMRDHAGEDATADELLEVWRLALANVEKSSFLRYTRTGSTDLTFMCQRKSFTKLVEGGYGNGAHAYGNEKAPENEWDRIDRVLGKTVEIESDDDYKLIEGTLA